MYCSHCGSSTPDELNFCKNCGARNERQSFNDDSRTRRLTLAAAAGVGLAGLGGFYLILQELIHNPLITPGYVLLIMGTYLLAVLTMFSVFVRMSRRDKADIRSVNSNTFQHGSPYLPPVTTAQLSEPRDTPASVTEVTTRALNEVPRKRT